jgi:hypothetical protein
MTNFAFIPLRKESYKIKFQTNEGRDSARPTLPPMMLHEHHVYAIIP